MKFDIVFLVNILCKIRFNLTFVQIYFVFL